MPFSNGDEALIKNTYPFKQEIWANAQETRESL